MASLKGTKTEGNLLKAFAGESQARNRYTFFASKARKEGFLQAAKVFETTADQEKEHAKRFFNFLEGGELEIVAAFPAGKVGTTAENLEAAACGEKEEWSQVYPAFAATAKEEGFGDVAATFNSISVAEKHHQERYQKLLDTIKAEKVFIKDDEVVWQCTNCGYLHKGKKAPEKCPACLHPKEYYELLGENY